MTDSNHILYHGATTIVKEPLTQVGRGDLDFGPGFYVTNEELQATSWAKTKASRKKDQKAFLNIYRFDVEGFMKDSYAIKVFPEYNVEWLDFIAFSRKGGRPWEPFDWIEGGIANDSVISTVDAYTDGMITAEKAMDKLINEKLRHQICIRKQEIIDKYITFEKAIEV